MGNKKRVPCDRISRKETTKERMRERNMPYKREEEHAVWERKRNMCYAGERMGINKKKSESFDNLKRYAREICPAK